MVGFYESGMFAGEGREYPYLRCEYIDGGSIKDNLEAGRRPADADALPALLTGLLAGVGEIHDLGIFHRDIKPANVALRERDSAQPSTSATRSYAQREWRAYSPSAYRVRSMDPAPGARTSAARGASSPSEPASEERRS